MIGQVLSHRDAEQTAEPPSGSRLKVLWISHFVPFPPKGGCFQRSFNLIQRIGTRCDLHLLAFRHKRATHPEDETRLAREELLRSCRSVEIVDISATTEGPWLLPRALQSVLRRFPLAVAMFESPTMQSLVRSAASDTAFDIVHFDTISVAPYLRDIGESRTIMTHHGAESFMIARRIALERSLFRKWFFRLESRTLRRYEQEECGRFGLNIVMTTLDREILEAIAPDASFAVVENGVDINFFSPGPIAATPSIIFAGRLDQYSNRDGILHFMDVVWPRVKATHPLATIRIIGSNPPPRLREIAAADPSVSVPGFVDDVRPYFRQAAVAICPVRDGGGMRIKILDALAQGMPVVSTSIGCEGIEVVNGQDLLLADSPEEFARQIGRLFDDAELRSRLGRNGRQLVERVYSWDTLATKLMGHYEALTRDGANRVQRRS